jgi:hypothetical protein
MFDPNDPTILWVSPVTTEVGDGTSESPFSDIDRALFIVKPGNTIVLRPGRYSRNVTVEVSGTLRQPIRIAAEKGALIQGACWFFYDVNNLIVSGIGFHRAPNGAIAVIGACSHNRFEELTFIDCGVEEKSSCTMYFGGSGGACNVVENCRFERQASAGAIQGSSSIALMVSEGDNDDVAAIRNHVFRKNRFINYTTGIVVGSGDAPAGQYGHIVEYNTLEQCSGDALLVKCGDTQVRGNLIRRCNATAIMLAAGSNSVLEANRIMDSVCGMSVNGFGHTIENNCLIRCGNHGIHGRSASQQELYTRLAATNLFIEHNTFVDCGKASSILCEEGATGAIRKNLFSGKGAACVVLGRQQQVVIRDNRAFGGVESTPAVIFKDPTLDDYTSDSGYGATGWVVTPEAFDPQVDDIEPENDYCAVDIEEEAEVEPESEDEAGFESFMGRFFQEDEDGEPVQGELS